MGRHVTVVLGMDDRIKNPITNQAYTEDELAQIATQCLETGTSPFLEGLAQNALEDVLRKHEAIVQIERNVNEVAQLFQDLALLVESQGEQLDRIEANVRPPLPAPLAPLHARARARAGR
jgi:t-SNARE complex subunit (syntaxin)